MTDLLSQIASAWERLLELSALILGIINGLILLREYLRDRPKLMVEPIHPDTYQWFFKLPSRELHGHTTRKFGFLTYLSITNRGLRDVSLNSWRLHIRTAGGKRYELRPMSTVEPSIRLGQSDSVKTYAVLGVKGVVTEGETWVRAGGGIAGFAYYLAEFFGGDQWNPVIKEGTVTETIVVSDVFGKKTSAKIVFKEIPLKKAKEMVKDIDKIDAETLFNDTIKWASIRSMESE